MELETKQNYARVQGVRTKKIAYFSIFADQYAGSTHVKEIPNTKLLVSIYHSYKRAKMVIYDISRKVARNIETSEEIVGGK